MRLPTSMKSLLPLLLCPAFPSSAQVLSPDVAQREPIPGAGHSYIGLGAETVNPADGSVSFNLPIKTPEGRQLSIPFGIRFSSIEPFSLVGTGTNSNFNWKIPDRNRDAMPFQVNGWSYGLPFYQAQAQVVSSQPVFSGGTRTCWASGSFTFLGFDQRLVPISIQNRWPDTSNPSNDGCAQTTYPAGGVGPDGIGATFQPDPAVQGSVQPPLDIQDPSGTTYHFVVGPGISTNSTVVGGGLTPFGLLANSISDRNGNTISLQGGSSVYLGGNALRAGSYKDTVGRTAVAWSGLGNSAGDHVTVSGLGGEIVLKWRAITPTLPQHIGRVYGDNCSFGSGSSLAMSVVSEIDLPNGTKYGFDYGGQWGLLNRITFPNGGYIRYVWGTNPLGGLTGQSWTQGSATYGCSATYDTPAITDRFVSTDGSTETLHQVFDSYSTTWTQYNGNGFPYWSSKSTTVSDYERTAQGQWELKGKKVYTYGFADGRPNQIPVERSIVTKDSGDNVKQTVYKTWQDVYVPYGEQTVWDDGSATTTLFCPDTVGNIKTKYEYDFKGSSGTFSDPGCFGLNSPLSSGLQTGLIGPLLRQTDTTFHIFGSGNTFTHIWNAPDMIVVRDGSGTQVAKTVFSYDETPAVASGAQQGLSSVPYARGNATTIARSIDGSTSSTTKYTYFDTGQVQQMTDPCGLTSCPDMSGASHTTTFAYTDDWSSGSASSQTSAYLTSVTDALSHTRKYKYDYATGQVGSSKDNNDYETTYAYADTLGRLSGVDTPAAGQASGTAHTSHTYVDGAGASVTTVGPTGITTKTSMDGLGRTTESLLSSDPGGVSKTGTTYDGRGNVQSVSNPYRSTSDETYGGTTYAHDALNRVVLECESLAPISTPTMCPSGTGQRKKDYNGHTVTVTDENGHTQVLSMDGLGRLQSVTEPSGAVTRYTYNARNDLIGVVQAGVSGEQPRSRSFEYDMLSRLTKSTNPETGTVCYGTYTTGGSGSQTCTGGYDANGNLSKKTDQRGIVTSFTYDNLNRLVRRDFSDGTASDCWSYDTVAGGKGYLASQWTQWGGCAAGSNAGVLTSRSVAAYDRTGRPTQETQCIVGVCTGQGALSMDYNAIGSLSSYYVPTAHELMHVEIEHNAADWANAFKLSVAGATTSSDLLRISSFVPTGALKDAAVGSNLLLTDTYDSRLRTTGEAVHAK